MILIYVFLAILALFILLKSRSLSRNRKRPPGPRGLPIFGCALTVNESNMLEKLFTYAEEYGDIFGIKLLNDDMICLNSEGIIRKALTSDPCRQHMNDRCKLFYSDKMYYGSQSVFSYPDSHSKVYIGMRKGITRGLNVYGQGGTNENDLKMIEEIQKLNQKIESFGESDFDVLALLQQSLTNVVSVVLSGEVLSNDDEDVNMFWDFVNGIDYFLHPSVNNLLSMFPILRFAPGHRKKFNDMSKAKEIITERYFRKIRRRTTDGEPQGYVGNMIELQKTSLEGGEEVVFTDERIISNLLEFCEAGMLTSLATLASTLLCLVNHQEYQDKVFKEVDEIIGRDRLPNNADRKNCPYLEALELEVHRLLTVGPILVGRVCTKDVSLEGYDIAKGTMLLINIWFLHHNPKIWGDPWKFRPERFLDTDGKLLPRDHIFRKSLIPFAIGRRQCVGEQFGRYQYFLYMATLLKRWKFVGSPGKFGPCDPRKMEYFDTNLSFRPKPFFCKVEKRY